MSAPPVVLEQVDHSFGEGALRKQILYDVNVEIGAGEIVIVTGPSGSGKTTLLTLIGALRSAQEGSLRVLGQELRNAGARTLQNVRKGIGYIFQAHNLLDSLSARQNVELSLHLHPNGTRRASRRAVEMLQAVGLGDHVEYFPSQLSGGMRQRVAIARALAGEPRLILADEPTASLDRESGRDVVDLMHRLAKEQEATVLLVTHDNRILDIADRILHLEDGRLQSFTDSVISNTEHMMGMLAQSTRKGELSRRVADMPVDSFVSLLEQVTSDSERFLQVTEMSENEAFESMLEQALEAFTFKLGEVLDAERASIFLVDEERGELWLKVAQDQTGRAPGMRISIMSGIAGHVASTGQTLRIDDAYSHPLFNPAVDRHTGFRTRSILCVPLKNRSARVFAVAQLLNKRGGKPFEEKDEARFGEFAGSISVILENWWAMSGRTRSSRPASAG
jgi:putative ABC transport system ATP-binding protein